MNERTTEDAAATEDDARSGIRSGSKTSGATTPAAAGDGGTQGYRSGATLPFRAELRRQVRRRRTALAFGLVVALPLVLVAAFTWGSGDGGGLPSFGALATVGGVNFTVFTLATAAALLLTLIVALVCGDAVAGEAGWGSLRYLLAVPVPRARLLGVKLAVGLATSVVALLVLTVTSLAVGTAVFGWHPLRTPRGDELPAMDALWRIALMVGYLAVCLLLVAALAFWFSVRTDAPLVAVGGAVLVVIVANILDAVEALGGIRSVLPMHYAAAWRGLFTDPMQWEDLAKGTLSSLAYTTVFLALAWWTFLRKDVLS